MSLHKLSMTKSSDLIGAIFMLFWSVGMFFLPAIDPERLPFFPQSHSSWLCHSTLTCALHPLWLKRTMRDCSQSTPASKETENIVFHYETQSQSLLYHIKFWVKIYHLPCGFKNIDNNNEYDNGDDDDDDKLCTLLFSITIILSLQ